MTKIIKIGFPSSVIVEEDDVEAGACVRMTDVDVRIEEHEDPETGEITEKIVIDSAKVAPYKPKEEAPPPFGVVKDATSVGEEVDTLYVFKMPDKGEPRVLKV